MELLKRLFGGGAARPASGRETGDRAGLYFYVRPTGCQEVIRVRIDKNNDPSMADDGTYFVIKTVRGSTYQCNRSAELHLHFDRERRLQSTDVTGGALVDQAEYESWLAAQAG